MVSRKVAFIGAVILLTTFTGAMAKPITTTYAFIPSDYDLWLEGGFVPHHEYHSIAGTLQLTVDADTREAYFSSVDAKFSSGGSLDNVMYLTSLVGTLEKGEINFTGYALGKTPNNVLLQYDGDTIHLTGGYRQTEIDGMTATLDAYATAVPEPATLALLALGWLAMKRTR